MGSRICARTCCGKRSQQYISERGKQAKTILRCCGGEAELLRGAIDYRRTIDMARGFWHPTRRIVTALFKTRFTDQKQPAGRVRFKFARVPSRCRVADSRCLSGSQKAAELRLPRIRAKSLRSRKKLLKTGAGYTIIGFAVFPARPVAIRFLRRADVRLVTEKNLLSCDEDRR